MPRQMSAAMPWHRPTRLMMISLTVMMYHYVREAGDAAQGDSRVAGMPTARFTTQLDALSREYEMVSWEEVRSAILENKSLPERACLITFDDGTCDHYLNVFPALKARGMSGLFFVMARQNETGLILGHKLHYLLAEFGLDGLRSAVWENLNTTQRKRFISSEAYYRKRWSSEMDVFKGILQRDLELEISPLLSELVEHFVGSEQALARHLYLTPEQIREMRTGGMRFGGHSRTHPWFDFIDDTRREQEICASRDWLMNFEQAPFAFAYPYGGLADAAPAQLSRANFGAAFTTRAGREHKHAFYIGRYDGEAWNE